MGLWGTAYGGAWGSTRTALHVMISGSDSTGTGTLANPWRTIQFGVDQLVAGVSKTFDSTTEELWVWYDATTAYTEVVNMPNRDGLRVVGVDSAGVPAYAAAWNCAEKVEIDASGLTDCLVVVFNHHFMGFKLNGGGSNSGTGVEGFAGLNLEIWLEDCEITGFGSHGVTNLGTLSILERVESHHNGGTGILGGSAADGTIMRACHAHHNTAGGIGHSGDAGLVEQCAAWLNGGIGIDARNGGPTVRNCVMVDNGGIYGLFNNAGLFQPVENCVSYSSDPALYHTANNYAGSAYAGFVGNLETDPLLDTNGRPSAFGPAFASGYTPTTTPYDVERVAFLDPPTRGALEASIEFQLLVRGRNLLRAFLGSVFASTELETIDGWSIDPDAHTLISTIVDAGSGWYEFRTDRPLITGTEYTLETLLGTYPGASWSGVGKALEPGATRQDLADLLDIDAPLVRKDRAGGDYTIDETGDYRLTGGGATVLKMVWDVLLTQYDELLWAPGYGTRLEHKRPAALGLRIRDESKRLQRLLEDVPYVRSALVSVEVGSNYAEIKVSVETPFGQFAEARQVTR